MGQNDRVHDLSASLEDRMPVWPGTSAPVIEPIGTFPRDGYSLERIACSTHTGTHVDAPYHFLEEGRTVDLIPPSDLIGRGIMLDLRAEVDGPRISRAMLERHFPEGPTPEIVLLQTGWSHRRAPTRSYLYEFPGLDTDAARWLGGKASKAVGTDTLSIDPHANDRFEAHKILLGRGLYLIEALDHLDALREGTVYTIVVAPLRIRGGSGAMSRVLAIEP